MTTTWLTTADVAAHLERDPSTVRSAAECGALHGHQPTRNGRPVGGGRWIFAKAAVERFVQGVDEQGQRTACCARLDRLRRRPAR